MKRGRKRSLRFVLVEASPLRQADPRAKLALSLCASLAVMLPLERLVFFIAGYILLLVWARLLGQAARQLWRIRWVLIFIFVADWVLVDLAHAATVGLRIGLLSGVLTLAFATTTPGEFSLALEALGLPYRYAFSLGLAFNSLLLVEEEWQTILEAQASRGILPEVRGPLGLARQLGGLVALTVPAVVLTTRRAWAITEAAHARGFDSPERRPSRRLRFHHMDYFLTGLAALAALAMIFWR